MTVICSSQKLPPCVGDLATEPTKPSPRAIDCFYQTPVIKKIDDCGSNSIHFALTGEMERHLALRVSLQLSSNLEAAAKTVDHVQKTVLYSTNYLRSPSGLSDKSELTKSSHLYQSTIRELSRSCVKNCPIILFKYIEKFQVGNCEEMSTAGQLFLSKSLNMENVEKCQVRGGDHVFLIIGGNEDIPFDKFLKNPALDPDAVICDPWAKAYYPAPQLYLHLKDYVRITTTDTGMCYTRVKDFNPETQSIFKRIERLEVTEEEARQLEHSFTLFDACAVGNKNAVLQLLKKNGSFLPSYDACIGATIAIKHGHFSIFELVLKPIKNIQHKDLALVKEFACTLNNKELTTMFEKLEESKRLAEKISKMTFPSLTSIEKQELFQEIIKHPYLKEHVTDICRMIAMQNDPFKETFLKDLSTALKKSLKIT